MSMAREYPSLPIIGVGIFLIENDRVALVQRGKPPRKGAWSVPGGALELGESLEQAARRELYEETGLEASELIYLDTVELIARDEDDNIRHHYVLFDYAARWSSGEIRAGDDAMDAKWFDHSTISKIDLWSETRRLVAKSFELLRS